MRAVGGIVGRIRPETRVRFAAHSLTRPEMGQPKRNQQPARAMYIPTPTKGCHRPFSTPDEIAKDRRRREGAKVVTDLITKVTKKTKKERAPKLKKRPARFKRDHYRTKSKK